MSCALAQDKVPAELSDVTALNITMISAALAAHNNAVNTMIAARTDELVRIRQLAAKSQARVEREKTVYTNTGGAPVVRMFDSLAQQADAAGHLPARLEEQAADVRRDVGAAVATSAITTDKLDAAAKKLASLAQPQSGRERAKELLDFIRDVKKASDKLREEADAKAASGGVAMKVTVPHLEALAVKADEKEIAP